MKTTTLTLMTSSFLSAALVACGSDPKPSARTGADVDLRTGYALTPERKDDPSYVAKPAGEPDTLVLSSDTAKRCNLPEPNFAFDSARVRDAAETSLDRLTACLTDGALGDENISLVGHADERGPSSYNLALGQRRAARVKNYLVDNGVDAQRITTSSRGEMQADAANGHSDDRRVEISIRN